MTGTSQVNVLRYGLVPYGMYRPEHPVLETLEHS